MYVCMLSREYFLQHESSEGTRMDVLLACAIMSLLLFGAQTATFAAGGKLHRVVSAMYFRCAIFGGSDPTDQRGCGFSTNDSASVTFLKNS
jgi:hypothetical protein